MVFVAEHRRAEADERLGRGYGLDLAVVHNGVDEMFRAAGPRAAPRMAAALPVVCSDIPGMHEVGGDAVLARPREDVDALADALASLAEDERAYREWSRRAWERAGAFTWDRAAWELLEPDGRGNPGATSSERPVR